VISHDREFLDRVVTSTLVLEGEGRVGEYVGGYSDWVRQRPRPSAEQAPPATAAVPSRQRDATPRPARAKKLSYNDQRELDQLPARIETLESPALYRDDPEAVPALRAQLEAAEASLEVAFERWSELEG
jgi:ATP-binding cassette subfamily F protein uup